MLEVKNLMVFFENALALNDFNMNIEQGEIVALLGGRAAEEIFLGRIGSGAANDIKHVTGLLAYWDGVVKRRAEPVCIATHR